MNKDYKIFLSDVMERVRNAQYEALKEVNKKMIGLYWDLGKMISEKSEWGKSFVENLSKDLQNEFPKLRGFSVRNLWNMQQLYLQYKDNVKLQPLVAEISWTKHLVILQKCKDDNQKHFYILMTKKYGWTKNVLIHQIENKSYEKYLLNQTNFDQTLPEKYRNQATLAVKDEYTFDFLELSNEHSEHELETTLINNIRKFLTEMGGYFCFVGNQYRLEVDGKEFFIDLLLYHRQLRSLVAVELKVGDFKPEYAGKMQFYLSVLNDKNKLSGENDAIGIIICKNKNRTVVEYALKDTNKPIGVATYTITTHLPEKLAAYLPTEKQLEQQLADLEKKLNDLK